LEEKNSSCSALETSLAMTQASEAQLNRQVADISDIVEEKNKVRLHPP